MSILNKPKRIAIIAKVAEFRVLKKYFLKHTPGEISKVSDNYFEVSRKSDQYHDQDPRCFYRIDDPDSNFLEAFGWDGYYDAFGWQSPDPDLFECMMILKNKGVAHLDADYLTKNLVYA